MLRNLLFVLVMAPGLAAAVARPYWALLLYLWYAFFRPEQWIWMNVRGLRLSLVVGIILLASSLLRGKFPSLRHPLCVLILAFLGVAILAQVNAFNPAVGWRWIDFFARLVIVCLLAVSIVRTPAQLMGVVAVIGLSLGFHGAKAGLHSIISGGLQFSAGLAGAFVDNNGYALALVMVTPFLILTAQHPRLAFGAVAAPRLVPFIRVALYILGPLTAYGVISTFSRGGFISLIAMLVAWLLVHPKRARVAVAIGLMAAAAVTWIQLPEGFEERIATIQPGDLSSDPEFVEDRSAGGRLHFWGVALEMVAAEPLGVGLRNYEWAYRTFDSSLGAFGNFRAVHNSHLQVLAELGYLGAVVWITLFVYAVWICLRMRRRAGTPGLDPELARFFTNFPNAMLASMAGFIAGGMFISLALNDLTWMTFALLAIADRLSAEACRNPVTAVAEPRAATETPTRRFTPAVAGTPAPMPRIRVPAAARRGGAGSTPQRGV